MMFEDVCFSVSGIYLSNLGIDFRNPVQLRQAVFLMGGDPNNITINKDAWVRVKNRPYMVYKDTMFVVKRRKDAYVKNLCGEGESLTPKFHELPVDCQLCESSSLPYSENYQEQSAQNKRYQEYMFKQSKNHKQRKNKPQKSFNKV